jgi:hypothetical protein
MVILTQSFALLSDEAFLSRLNLTTLFIFRAANVMINHLPEMKKILLEALDLVFIPKQIACQLVLAVALETTVVGKCGVILVFFASQLSYRL